MSDVQVVNCRDSCGAAVGFPSETSMEEARTSLTEAGWVWLDSAFRWRCPTCSRKLSEVTAAQVSDPAFVDEIAPRSRGALPKNTAETIKPPVDVAKEANSQLDWG